MARGLVGKKVGMTQVFDPRGDLVSATVLQLGPNQIVQVKQNQGRDGYDAIKIGYEAVDPAKLNRPERGVFYHAGTDAFRHVQEFRVGPEEIEAASVGEELTVGMFAPGEHVDVTGYTKGRGFQGVVRRHGFNGTKEMTHGCHDKRRHPGAIGAASDPSRVQPGKKLPGRMGNRRVTVQSLSVVAVYPEENVLLVRGAVPGPKNGLVFARVSRRQRRAA